RAAINNGQYVTGRSPFEMANQKIAMYPNPVTEHRFQLSFEETGKGIHTIQVLDLSGKVLFNKIINISGPGQYEGVELQQTMSKGMYMVKVLNSESKTIYTSKFLMQ
ncbi:MAG: T9SS type A sorting domain-containing protein, partial [Lacibacter sp.]|nr:T9SS type A sorting domain-containing protein [Lacibacter sp.]